MFSSAPIYFTVRLTLAITRQWSLPLLRSPTLHTIPTDPTVLVRDVPSNDTKVKIPHIWYTTYEHGEATAVILNEYDGLGEGAVAVDYSGGNCDVDLDGNCKVGFMLGATAAG
jgi:hypothetical protein